MSLVVTCRSGESVYLGGCCGDTDIVVTAADVRGDRVSLSIDAPRRVKILRWKVLEKHYRDIAERCRKLYQRAFGGRIRRLAMT